MKPDLSKFERAAQTIQGQRVIRQGLAWRLLGLRHLPGGRTVARHVRAIVVDVVPHSGAPRGRETYWLLADVLDWADDLKTRRDHLQWTDREIAVIKKHLGDEAVDQVAKRIGRSIGATRHWIRHHRRKNALRLRPRGVMTITQTARLVGRSYSCVYNWCEKFGLPTSMQGVCEKRRCISHFDLHWWLLRNPEILSSLDPFTRRNLSLSADERFNRREVA